MFTPGIFYCGRESIIGRFVVVVVVQSLSCVQLFVTPGLQHARLPLLSPRVCFNSCPLNLWCYPIISLVVAPFFYCHQSFPASESFSMSHLFVSGGKITRASASASILPMNIQDWLPLELTGLFSLLSKGLKNLLQYHSLKASILQCSAFFMVQHLYPYMTTVYQIIFADLMMMELITVISILSPLIHKLKWKHLHANIHTLIFFNLPNEFNWCNVNH